MSVETIDEKWTPITLNIQPGTPATGVVGACVCEQAELRLAQMMALDEIQKLRERHLAAADSCGDERQWVRACIAALCDLYAQGWHFRIDDTQLLARKPFSNSVSLDETKARVRAGLLLERDQQLRIPSVRTFVQRMERRHLGPNGWTSIFSLMRDGKELADALHSIAAVANQQERVHLLGTIIDPYVQVVDGSTCPHTGFLLQDIWRYFRHTWVTPYNSVPGRSIAFLIRDRAAANHPIIGIAALGSAIVQLSVRDQWIGWDGQVFVERLRAEPDDRWAQWVQHSLEKLIGDIYLADFQEESLLSPHDLLQPTPDLLQRLRACAVEARRKHRFNPKLHEHKSFGPTTLSWETKARTELFRAKRAETLANLLEAKLLLTNAGFAQPTGQDLAKAMNSSGGRTAIRRILRLVKAAHVGINMMDITVCGAIAPYNAILGGKLVSLLMTSPEVTAAYRKRYQDAVSIIASSMAGRPVRRTPHLVLLGTTSLYEVGASQYNRLHIPISELSGIEGELRYIKLGTTEGFGSFHFSSETLREFQVLLANRDEGRRVNSLFGEGVNPRLRKIRDALDLIGLSGDLFLNHGHRRVIYGIPLAINFREYLLGLNQEVTPILPQEAPAAVTACIASYWTKRWLARRIEQEQVLDEVARQRPDIYPVTHRARVPLPNVADPDMPLLAGDQ